MSRGQKRSVVEIVVSELVMLDSRQESQQPAQGQPQQPAAVGADEDEGLPF